MASFMPRFVHTHRICRVRLTLQEPPAMVSKIKLFEESNKSQESQLTLTLLEESDFDSTIRVILTLSGDSNRVLLLF